MRTREQLQKRVVDDDEARHTRWTVCRLSRQRLTPPVVIDRLGQLYNKDALLEYLIKRTTKSTSEEEDHVARHIKSLKGDVRDAVLHPNPVPEDELGEAQYFPFACPISQRVMNGKHRFVCLWPCGCVASESALREMCSAKAKDAACPQCTKEFKADALWEGPSPDADVVWLYPPPETMEHLRAQLAQGKKKRKKGPDADTAKRAKAAVERDTRPRVNATAPGAYAVEQMRAKSSIT